MRFRTLMICSLLATGALTATEAADWETDETWPVEVTDASTNVFTDLIVGSGGYLTGSTGDTFVVSGDFLNASAQGALWSTTLSELRFQAGVAAHQVTFAGADMGPSYFGYQNNFAWGTLHLTSGQALMLGDGNATPGAAMYVTKLVLDGGLGQIARITGNGANIYYDPTNAANAYLNAQTYPLAGGGAIIPVIAVLQIVTESKAAGGVTLTCKGVPSRLHTVQASPNLASATFAPIGTATADASGNLGFTDPAAGGFTQRFYRLVFP